MATKISWILIFLQFGEVHYGSSPETSLGFFWTAGHYNWDHAQYRGSFIFHGRLKYDGWEIVMLMDDTINLKIYPYVKGSRDSAMGIATGYWLAGWGVGIWVPVGARFFSSRSCPDRCWGPTQPPIQWVPGTLFLGVKQPGCEADHVWMEYCLIS
jgi:hypothetical protein